MIAAYIRVSTLEQANSGLSLEAQRDACSRYAQLHIADGRVTFFEEHKSAASLSKRPVLRQLLSDLVPIDHLIVIRLDRLARNTLDLLTILRTLDTQKIALHSVRENLDTQGPTGQLFVTMLAAMAQFERDLIAQRTSEALRAKQRRGEHVGRLPFGATNRNLDFDLAKLQIVRQVFLLHKVHTPLRSIAALTDLNVSTVRYILTNQTYRRRGLL